MSSDDAREMAYDKGYDLVLMAPQAQPPVCRIMDYGKYRFEQQKREKEAKKNQHQIDIKEVQLSLNIDTHDFETKRNAAIKFLTKGDKVKVSIRFRGREMAHTDIGKDILRKFAEGCGEVGNMDKDPKLEGRNMSMFISPKSQAQIQKAAKEKKKQQEEAAEETTEESTEETTEDTTEESTEE